MDCSVVREIISVALDGEGGDNPQAILSEGIVTGHLGNCNECVAWQLHAEALHRSVRVGSAEEIPDLTSAILVAIGNRPAAARQEALRACRWLLAICALLQLAVALPSLVGSVAGPIHLDHELGSWDIGLAFGFLIAAVQPSRAWGMLPFIFVVGTALGITSVIDILSGSVSATRETAHVSELMGFVFTFIVARLNSSETKLRYAFS